ncbi:hypothetical protein HKX48_005740 [Thoreauomyces humboldtii]|nr:hypothetical protein HKX48_005740 [Thoreauomyces humboldtii]
MLPSLGYLHRRGESTLLGIRAPKSVCERIDLDLRKSFGTSPDQIVIHNVTDADFVNALVIERFQPGNHLLGSSGDLDAASFSEPHPSFAHFRSLSDPISRLPFEESATLGVTAALHMSRATSSVALGAAGIVAGTTRTNRVVILDFGAARKGYEFPLMAGARHDTYFIREMIVDL